MKESKPGIFGAVVWVPLIALLFIAVVSVQVSYGQEADPGFPEHHKDFLGASSYRALFGLNAGFVAPGPGSSDTGAGRPPRVGPNTAVNDPQLPFPDGLLGRSETTIAAGGDGNFLVAGWNDAEGFCGPPFNVPCTPPPIPGASGYGFSTDQGRTWIDGGAPFVGSKIAFPTGFPDRNYVTRGDPALDVGGIGKDTFYYANLAVFEDGNPGRGVSVHTGSFSGLNFTWTEAVLLHPPNLAGDFLDKPLLAADKRGDSEAVYVSVTNFKEVCNRPGSGFGQIEVYGSQDGGATWSRTLVQPDEAFVTDPDDPLCGLDGIVNQGSMPAVSPNGEIYVAWERGWFAPFVGGTVLPRATIAVATSTDGGATFSAPVQVTSICSGAVNPPAGYNRRTTNDFPRIAVAQSGPHRGRVYVTFQDCSPARGPAPFGSDTDIFVSFSDDDGATWSPPVLAAGGADGNIQFWPTVSVQPGGNVDVTYYESVETDVGNGPTSLVDYFWVQSVDGGTTWEAPVRVSTMTTDWGFTATNITPNFGDYNTAVSAGNRVFATWSDGRNGQPDVFFSEILSIGKAPR